MTSATCSSCGAPIIWAEKRGVISPKTGLVQIVDAYTPHWATCSSPEKFRRRS